MTQFSGGGMSVSSVMSELSHEDDSALRCNKAKVVEVAELTVVHEKQIQEYELKIKELEQRVEDLAKAKDIADKNVKILGAERSKDYKSATTAEASKSFGVSLNELSDAQSEADDALRSSRRFWESHFRGHALIRSKKICSSRPLF